MQKRSDATMKELKIEIEELEPKVAPSAHGQLGYEGQPGNQGNGLHRIRRPTWESRRPLKFVSEWRILRRLPQMNLSNSGRFLIATDAGPAGRTDEILRGRDSDLGGMSPA